MSRQRRGSRRRRQRQSPPESHDYSTAERRVARWRAPDQRLHPRHLYLGGQQLHLHRLTHSPLHGQNRRSTSPPRLHQLARRARLRRHLDQRRRRHLHDEQLHRRR